MNILHSFYGRRLGFGNDGTLIYQKGAVQNLLPLQTPVAVTASTLTAAKDSHANRLVILNRAAGIAVTLPAATGTGDTYEFLIGTTITSNTSTIACAGSDTYTGLVMTTSTTFGAAGDEQAAGGTNKTLTMNGTTQGGIIGSYVRVRDYATNKWDIYARLIGSGTLATSLS